MNTIISTHPIPMMYCKWDVNEQTHQQECIWDFTVPGGAGVVNKRTLLVPDGVATSVGDDILETLMTIPTFKRDIENGYIKVIKGKASKNVDANEEALKDMNTNASGKQITDAELVADGAVLNDDGSIDVTKGGANATIKHSQQGAKDKAEQTRRGGRRRKTN